MISQVQFDDAPVAGIVRFRTNTIDNHSTPKTPKSHDFGYKCTRFGDEYAQTTS